MLALNEILYNWFRTLISNDLISARLTTAAVGLLILLIAWLLLYITRRVFVSFAHQFAGKTKTQWDDILIKYKFFLGVAHFAPAFFIYFNANFANLIVPGTENLYFENIQSVLTKINEIYFLFAGVFILNSFLSSVNEIYNHSFNFAKERPISGFIQLMKIFVYFVAVLFLISVIFDKELTKLFTGLGAMAAILILVFKDTILGFVASIQISMNDMVKIGDWMEMKTRGADGEVLEINLTTVKVQNWDKTISMVPTYSLITESFVNWRGMEESGGRRIKRSINIDINSIKFCTPDMLKKFEKFYILKDYIVTKEKEIQTYNDSINSNDEPQFYGRRQTNLGIFRKYLEAYLHQKESVSDEMTFLVRHLQPTEKGLPIEIYVFSKDQRWAYYEEIQADIFDHVLAVLPEFGLAVFQNPTGRDFSKLVN